MKRQLSEIETKLRSMREVEFGYPQGKNYVKKPPATNLLRELLILTGIPASSDLAEFYRLCNGISMPDLHVGYFLHDLGTVLRGIHWGEPVMMEGAIRRKIVVIGSDGGGGLFAHDLEDFCTIYHLPPSLVHDGVYDGNRAQVRIVAKGYAGFLERILEDLTTYIFEDQRDGFIV